MKQDQKLSLSRSTSCNSWSSKIIPSNFSRSTSSTFSPDSPRDVSHKPFVRTRDSSNSTNSLVVSRVKLTRLTLSTFFRSLLHVFSFSTSSFSAVPTCRWLTIPNRVLSLSSPTPLGRKVTGTLFGHRKGHVTFAVQDDPRADPALLIELAISTSALVREMSSGLVRIALECERGSHQTGRGKHAPKLFLEPVWTMYCNGRKCGYANSRACNEFDWHVLSTVQSVSVGAGVIPLVENRTGSGSGSEGELLYMRAKFERVVGNRDSEAFYMLNPDGNGGPELSIFLLRL
ncbi:protein MIZU-KUSSEI 1-like [Chenopodium quinoa]|uniref:protein MIZU-KUSSEI 1-like n=1 Tax=Chenopodium quinoa TaxID=63459 RepID=UPI000B7811A7|nr:protein MIZU-KUSSEI 1-like [Chenopodium quinoa]